MLGAQKSERELGSIMQSDLKVDMQCSKAANEANERLGMINRNFSWGMINRNFRSLAAKRGK